MTLEHDQRGRSELDDGGSDEVPRSMERRERRNEPGLSLRMQRERRVISNQHRQLDAFRLRLAAALDAGDLAEARACFWRFSDALEAHFALEEGFYFPALRGLAPALTHDLEALCAEHQILRERLAAVARGLEATTCEACVRPLARLASDLADHEGREEGLLASLALSAPS